MIRFIIFSLMMIGQAAYCQTNPLFQNLPVGKYAVGFKIITLTDSSRVTKPLYNYFGEKETSDRTWKIAVHIWYPAKTNSGKGTLTYGDYCYNQLLSSTNGAIAEDRKTGQLNAMRQNFQGFFGQIDDNKWQQLIATKLLAVKDAEPLKEKFPLLIGMLRPLSTSVTNEMLASNGYVVAMVANSGGRLPEVYISNIADLQFVMSYLTRNEIADPEKIGTYGFSGAGFAQMLLAMHDPRIGALADIESALYGENLWVLFSKSNFYNTSQLRVPFLHIYGKELGKRDTNFEEFYKKKYSHRYHLLLNHPRLHHWDVATEGRASTTVLHLRGQDEEPIRNTFELSNIYLLHFFNSALKGSASSRNLLSRKDSFNQYPDSVWTIQEFAALPPPPDKFQFTELINRKGIDEALQLARKFHTVDSAADFLHQNNLNQLARQFVTENKSKEGLALMELAVELYPKEAWLWNNYADMQETAGNKDVAIRSSEKVLELLKDANGTDQSFNSRIKRSSAARLERLKKEKS